MTEVFPISLIQKKKFKYTSFLGTLTPKNVWYVLDIIRNLYVATINKSESKFKRKNIVLLN